MYKPTECPRCGQRNIIETEQQRWTDYETQTKRWDNEGGHEAGQRQDNVPTMRRVLLSCTKCGWSDVSFSADEAELGPDKE